MSEFELDGARPRMVSISLNAMKGILSLLEHELTEGEFESDAEFSMVKELLDECRQADESAGQIVWHPVRLVPYDPAKHAERFEDKLTPEEVWEGELPNEDGCYLVTGQNFNGSLYVGLSGFGPYFNEFLDNSVIAWAELPEPYVPKNRG